ncbi:MAG TPA: hypothetical protein VFZ37_08605 [Jiangellaceae bacterium]
MQHNNNSRRRVGDHAIVLGASLAGLATAAALAERFDRVTVIERDALPETVQLRRGVPQGRHAHLLLSGGLRALAALLPGFEKDLQARGGHVIPSDELRFYLGGGRLDVRTADMAVCGATRPFLEHVVRERVRSLDGVEFRDGCPVDGLATNENATRVTGVRIRTGDLPDVVAGDLVVDTTGRGSRSPHWLTELGYPEVAVERMNVSVRYTTRLFRRDPEDLDGCRHVVVAPGPGGRRGGLIIAVEDDRWLITLVGTEGERAPKDLPGFIDYAASLPLPELAEVASRAEPIGDAATGTFSSYLRHRYDKLSKLPAGFAVLGDAVCSLNPAYGQGMSVACLEAQTLGEVLDRYGLDRIGPRVLRRTKAVVDGAWSLSTGSDLADPAVEGPRPLSWRLISAYLNRVMPVAYHDPAVAHALFSVNALIDPPPRLMRPAIAARALTRRRNRLPSPATTTTMPTSPQGAPTNIRGVAP